MVVRSRRPCRGGMAVVMEAMVGIGIRSHRPRQRAPRASCPDERSKVMVDWGPAHIMESRGRRRHARAHQPRGSHSGRARAMASAASAVLSEHASSPAVTPRSCPPCGWRREKRGVVRGAKAAASTRQSSCANPPLVSRRQGRRGLSCRRQRAVATLHRERRRRRPVRRTRREAIGPQCSSCRQRG